MFANAIAIGALTFAAGWGGAPGPAPVLPPVAQITVDAAAFAYTENGDSGWTLTQEGIEHGHECVIHLSLRPSRAIVVSDSDPLCEAEAVQFTVDVGQDEESYGSDSHRQAGAVCTTDADCAAWSRAHGEEPSGYAAGK